jgi:penicillin-binding protein 1A
VARLRGVVVALLFAVLASSCAWTSPLLREAGPAVAQSSKIYAADGTLLTTLHAEQNRETVPLRQMPKSLRDAVVAIEDERFWHHKGVDLHALLRAAWSDALSGKIVEGGSTITQQYVKNVVLDQERTVHRKIREVALAYQLEKKVGKEGILERYLNTIYFGNGAYGVEAAAGTYFGTTAARLTLAQSALLAGLIRSPGNYDPYDNPGAARSRRATVLDKLAALHRVSKDTADVAAQEPLGVVERPTSDRYPAAYFVEQVKQSILSDPRYGGGDTPGSRRAELFTGGLRIYTTVDLGRQAAAEAAVNKILSKPASDPSAALVSLEPGTGYVRALVGGRDFFGGGTQAKFDLATQGRRPAGSSFKPFVLAAALAEGIPLTRAYSAPSRIDLPLAHSQTWHVKNYEGGAGGRMDLIEATVQSVNTVYAQLIMQVGPADAVAVAQRMGVRSPLNPYPSAVLGTNDVTPLDMASAYGTLANRGLQVDPVFITKVTSADGTMLYQNHTASSPALPPRIVDEVRPVLEQVVQRGTGVNARIGRPVAGKTGTGEEWRDAWFVGFTPELATAVWVGFPDAQRSMVPPLTRIRVQGGTWPTQIWQLYMSAALATLPITPFPPAAVSQADPAATLKPVPTLVGMPADQAEDRLALEGFRARRVSVPNGDYPPGYVVGQSPCAGCQAAAAATVTIQVGTGKAATAVPTVLGLTEAEARQALANAGFTAESVVQAEPPSSDAANRRGRVWKQSPAAGDRAVAGSSITIWLDPPGEETTTTG